MTADPTLLASRTLHASARGTLAIESWGTVDGTVERPVLHHPGAVAIIAQPSAGSLLLVRQWRYALRAWTLEIPAGTRVSGEDPAATARRELAEEAGFLAERIDEVLRFWPAPGVSDEELIVYRAHGLAETAAHPDPGELVARQVVPFAELPALVRSGAIRDAKTLLALGLLGIALH